MKPSDTITAAAEQTIAEMKSALSKYPALAGTRLTDRDLCIAWIGAIVAHLDKQDLRLQAIEERLDGLDVEPGGYPG